jgi:hypothetical protein
LRKRAFLLVLVLRRDGSQEELVVGCEFIL